MLRPDPTSRAIIIAHGGIWLLFVEFHPHTWAGDE
jgi:hypothetical protein